jgi:hypothetical protein
MLSKMALDTQIVREFAEFANDTQRIMGGFYREAAEDLRFYAGQLLTTDEMTKMRNQNRNAYQVNKIRRVINTYAGYERENRVSTVIAPHDDGDEQTAEQLSDVMLYTYDKGDAYVAISDAFDHSLKTGLSVVGISMDFNRDRVNGEIKFWWKPYNAVLIDPYFTKRDLSDAERCATRDLLSKEQVKALLPFVDAKEIDALPTGITDHKFNHFTLNHSNLNTAAKNLVTYDQYWVRSNKKVKLLVDMSSGEEVDVTDFDKEDVQVLLLQMREDPETQVELVKTTKPTTELHIIVGGQLLFTGPDPTGVDTYPFRPMIAYFEPYIDQFDLRIQGVIRAQKDPQRLYNRRMNQITDWLETRLHTGYKVVNGAVQDPESLLYTGQSRIVVVNKGFDPTNDVQQLDASDLPPNVLQHMQQLDSDILEISGLNETQLGADEGGNTQVSGRLAEVRASQGMTGSRGMFDAYEYTLKELGRVVLSAVQKNYSAEKVERIINEPPSPTFNDPTFGQYDAVVKQAVLTRTQRDAYYYEILRLKDLGVAIPDSEVLDAVPMQNKTKLRKLLEQQQQAAQAEQQRLQEQDARQAALTESAIESETARKEAETARASAQTGLLIERISRANENTAQAGLDRAKALTEIEGLQTDRLLKVLQFLKLLEEPEVGSQQTQQPLGVQNVQRTESPSGEREGGVLGEQEPQANPPEGIEPV